MGVGLQSYVRVEAVVERLVEPGAPVRRYRRLIGFAVERSLPVPDAGEILAFPRNRRPTAR